MGAVSLWQGRFCRNRLLDGPEKLVGVIMIHQPNGDLSARIAGALKATIETELGD